MTVEQLIIQLLKCPMDAKVIGTVLREDDSEYSYFNTKWIVDYSPEYNEVGIMMSEQK